jgi:hypothetical protein
VKEDLSKPRKRLVCPDRSDQTFSVQGQNFIKFALVDVHTDGPSGVDEGLGAMTSVTVQYLRILLHYNGDSGGDPGTVHSLEAVPASSIHLLQELQAHAGATCKALLHCSQPHIV